MLLCEYNMYIHVAYLAAYVTRTCRSVYTCSKVPLCTNSHLCRHSGANNLEEVLGTLVQGALAFPDPSVSYIHVHSAEICKYRVSIRTHVVEGICIPLDVRHDLVRNVTTRGLGRGNTCT